jgi:hypothetical protein
VVLPDEVAPFGVAPPPAPAGALELPEVPPPEVPPPPVVPPDVPPPDVPPLEEPADELPVPDDADDDEDGEELLDDVEVVPVVLVVVDPVVAGAALMVAVGTVRGGTSEVSVVAADPPPHAATPAAMAAPAARALRMREPRMTTERRGTSGTSDLEWVHPPAAMRTVVQILLAVLVAPVAEAEVVDRPRQLRGRGRERQELADDLERLPGLAVDINLPGRSFDDDLTTGGWRPETVPLTRPHPAPSYSRGRTPAPCAWRVGPVRDGGSIPSAWRVDPVRAAGGAGAHGGSIPCAWRTALGRDRGADPAMPPIHPATGPPCRRLG